MKFAYPFTLMLMVAVAVLMTYYFKWEPPHG